MNFNIAVLTMMICSSHAAAESIFVPAHPVKQVTPETAAELKKLLPGQNKRAEKVSPEQAQTLAFGEYEYIKTTVVAANGKRRTELALNPLDLVRLCLEASDYVFKVYGVRVDAAKIGSLILTESGGVSRTGWSIKGDTPSFGLGQFERATANSLGLKNPNNPLEAAIAIARLLAEGDRFAQANNLVSPDIATSIAYNTSSKLRRDLVAKYGSSLAIHHLPEATQRHVINMRISRAKMDKFIQLYEREMTATVATKGAFIQASLSKYGRPTKIVNAVDSMATTAATTAAKVNVSAIGRNTETRTITFLDRIDSMSRAFEPEKAHSESASERERRKMDRQAVENNRYAEKLDAEQRADEERRSREAFSRAAMDKTKFATSSVANFAQRLMSKISNQDEPKSQAEAQDKSKNMREINLRSVQVSRPSNPSNPT